MSTNANKSREDVVLIDGTSLMYRAFFAIRELSGPQGQPTNAVYGFINMLLRLLEETDPDYAVVAFDKGAPQERLALYPDYKGHRPDMPEDLRPQFEMARELLDGLGVPYLEIEDVEADDVLGTLAHDFARDDFRIAIVTGDKDLLQLVGPNVEILLTRRGITQMETFDETRVEETYGISPAALVDMKGLMGDNSDNIPGIPGVGEKTALKLLKAHGSLEQVFEQVDAVSGDKLKEKLRKHQEDAVLSKRLAAICKNVSLGLTREDLTFRKREDEALREQLRALGFTRLLERLDLDVEAAPNGDDRTDPIALTALAAGDDAKWEAWWDQRPADTSDDPIILDYALNGDGGGYVAASHKESGWCFEFDSDDAAWIRTRLMEKLQSAYAFWGHYLKPLLMWGDEDALGASLLDLKIAAYLLDPARSSYPLTAISQKYLGGTVASRQEVRESEEAPALIALRLERLRDLYQPLMAELDAMELLALFREIEMPLIPILADMQRRGIRTDETVLREQGQTIDAQIADVSETIWSLAGREFNINSPKQLGEVLFEEMKLPVIKRTKTGYSANSEVLEALATEHEIANHILEYRTLAKLRGYVKGLSSEINPDTGRIHTTFHQTVTATGRLSSADPNLQNIPIRREVGRRLRRAFTAPEGDQLLAADYSQIELRILAHLSGDAKLVESFQRGEDIHQRTASEVFDVPLEGVTPKMRTAAKEVNFGLIYGMSGYGLSRSLKISPAESQAYIDQYFEKLPGVKAYMESIVAKAREQGYVRTLMGRIRYIPDLDHRVWHRRRFAERVALNTPIQGSAADIIKKAMVEAKCLRFEDDLPCALLLQVHDELIWEVPKDRVMRVARAIKARMEATVTLEVPLKVDLKAGPNWYDMEPLELSDDA